MVGVVNAKPKSKHVGRKQVNCNLVSILKANSGSKSPPDSGSKIPPEFSIPQLDGYGSGGKGGVAAEESSSDDDSDGDDSSAVS